MKPGNEKFIFIKGSVEKYKSLKNKITKFLVDNL